MKIPKVFKNSWLAIKTVRWLPIYNKRRRIVRLFGEFSKNPNNPAAYKSSGIPKQTFIEAMARKVVEAHVILGYKVPNKYQWFISEGEIYLNYAIDDKHIEVNQLGNLRISSIGEQYIRRFYYLKKYFGWTLEKVFVPFVSIPILALLIAWLATLVFGFRIDSFQIYGVSAVRRPELSYAYAKQYDGFLSIKTKGVDPEYIKWLLPTKDAAFEFESGNSQSPFILETDDIKSALLHQAIFLRADGSGDYSEKELKEGIDCVVLPFLIERGIPAGIRIDYSSEGENEVHTTRDLVFIRGVGTVAPSVFVKKRNVSSEEWYDFFTKQGEELNSTIKTITGSRSKYKDASGNCSVKYGNQPW